MSGMTLKGRHSLILLLWAVVIGAVYVFYISTTNVDETVAVTSGIIPMHWKPSYVNAVALIAASDMASARMVDYSIASIRKYGNWKGPIYVVTDKPNCFGETKASYGIDIVQIPETTSIIQIKSYKPKIMDLLPLNVTGVLYIDVDIVVTKDLVEFLYDSEQSIQAIGSKFDYAMFPDAAGHYVGFCSGCEKWHTGVMVLRRDQGAKCLAEWERILLSGKYDTDQASIDEAEKNNHCPGAVALSTKHLMFAKDYLAVLLTSERTFLHMTGAGRLDEQDFFYRKIAVPHFRGSLAKLDYTKFEGVKTCSGYPR